MANNAAKKLQELSGRIGAEAIHYAAGNQNKQQNGQQSQVRQKSEPARTMNAYVNQVQQKQTQGAGGGASTYDPYLAQANALYEQLMNRGPFKWDMQGDDVYRQYEDMYTNAGKLAMMDTMGTAVGLTGGYGNSYAALAGNQANQAYMTQLAAMIPDLEERAYQRWLNEGDQLMSQYELALSRAGSTGSGGSGSAGTVSLGTGGENGWQFPNLLKDKQYYNSADMNKAIASIAANGGLYSSYPNEGIDFDYYWKYLNQ